MITNPEIPRPPGPDTLNGIEPPIRRVDTGIVRGVGRTLVGWANEAVSYIRPVARNSDAAVISAQDNPVVSAVENNNHSSSVLLPEAVHSEIPEAPRSHPETLERLKAQGYVRPSPPFSKQVQDESRRGLVVGTDGQLPRHDGKQFPFDSVTEHAALVELDAFLARYADDVRAREMRAKLAFNGDSEVGEAAAGMLSDWRAFLEADKQTQLVFVAPNGLHNAYKSHAYILERALSGMSEEEFTEYARSGRIRLGMDAITSPPEATRIDIVDDIIETGAHLRLVVRSTCGLLPAEYHASIRATLVAAAEDHIDMGIALPHAPWRIPLQAYYLMQSAEWAGVAGVHVANAHSTPRGGLRANLASIRDFGEQMPLYGRVFRPYGDPSWRPVRVEQLRQQTESR